MTLKRIQDMIELEAFLFNGVPKGRHRDKYLTQFQPSPPSKGHVLQTVTINQETGELIFGPFNPPP